MRKFVLTWVCVFTAFAAAAGVASVIRGESPYAGAAMAVFFGFISWRVWQARKAPKAPPVPTVRPWER